MIIDLSHRVNENTPVYPGDPKTIVETAAVLEKDGYLDHKLTLGTHVGTHIDAPAHMVSGGKTLDQVAIAKFVGRGRLIKVENKTFDLQTVKDADISEGDIVLFYTDLAADYNNAHYFEDYPQIPVDIAQYLVDKKVSIVGMDMCSPDHEPFEIHKLLLGNNVLIIENLINLEQLIGKDFEITALPLNVEIDGAPARVIARL